MGTETAETSEHAQGPSSRAHSTPTHEGANFEQHGSSIPAAIFNFTNCIIGAGAIGLGGAFSASGGLISVVSLLGFGILTKISLDMVIQLSVEHSHHNASYEELALLSYGRIGWASVITSKTLYSFGCLVAYIIVVKDNFATALLHLLVKDPASDSSSMIVRVTRHDDAITWALSICVIFPLCLLRDMTSLSSLSMISVVSMVFIVVIVVYLFLVNPNHEIRQAPGGNVYQEWLVIRPGFVERYASRHHGVLVSSILGSIG
jgi:amino acid permease